MVHLVCVGARVLPGQPVSGTCAISPVTLPGPLVLDVHLVMEEKQIREQVEYIEIDIEPIKAH